MEPYSWVVVRWELLDTMAAEYVVVEVVQQLRVDAVDAPAQQIVAY